MDPGPYICKMIFFFNFACLGLVHWDNPEGWYGEGGRRRVQDGEHMYQDGEHNCIPVADSF